MDRREFLVTGSVGIGILGGCAASPGQSGTSNSQPEATENTATSAAAEPPIEVEATLLAEAVAPGDELGVEVSVTNRGETTRTVELVMALDGEVAATESLTVSADETISETLTTTVETVELLAVTVNGEHLGNVRVTEPTFDVEADIPVETIVGGEELAVEVTVSNTSEVPGTVDLVLALDGAVATRETVEIPAGDEVSVTLSTTITTLEPMSVTVNGEHIRDIHPTEPALDTYHVAVDGADSNVGSEAAPLGTIQEAMHRAGPGDTVQVHPGTYHQHPNTVRDGRADEPITITGPADSVIRGSLEITHSHIQLIGLTFDGLTDPEHPDDHASYSSHNIAIHPPGWVQRDYFSGYLEDITIKPHAVGNAQGSSISFKYTNHVEVGEFEVIGPAGVKHFKGGEPGHNGEIIYIGIPFDKWLDPGEGTKKQLDLDEFPVDESHDYHIHHIKHTAGHPHAELVDAKQGTYDVLIEYCTDIGGHGYYRLHDEKPPSDEASVHLGGSNVTLRWSVIENGRGAGVRIGNSGLVDEMASLVDFSDNLYPGTNNAVYGNRLLGNEGNAVEFPSIRHEAPFDNGPDVQKTICGNEHDGETMGDPDKPCPDWVSETDEIGHLGGDSHWK